MRITDIHATKRGRMALYTDGAFFCTLHPEACAQARLQIGDEVDEETLEELQGETQLKLLKEKAMRLLAGQDYTRRQLYDKLCRHGDEETAAQAVERMEELGLLDDENYAQRCARDLYHLKHYSTRRIAQELQRRGIDRAAIEEALAQFDGEDPREAVAALLVRRFSGYAQDERIKKRAVNALLRLGYSYEDIRYAMEHADEWTL